MCLFFWVEPCSRLSLVNLLAQADGSSSRLLQALLCVSSLPPPPTPVIADRRIDLSAAQYLMFIILASFCKSTLLTAL